MSWTRVAMGPVRVQEEMVNLSSNIQCTQRTCIKLTFHRARRRWFAGQRRLPCSVNRMRKFARVDRAAKLVVRSNELALLLEPQFVQTVWPPPST